MYAYILLICLPTDIAYIFLKNHFFPNSLHVNYTFPSQQTNHFSVDCIKMIPLPFSEYWFLFDFLRVKTQKKKKEKNK